MNRPETKSLLIKGGHLIDPAAKINAPMDIILRDGRVAEVALPNKTRGGADEKFDARGLIVAPGFIDLHVHFASRARATKRRSRAGPQPLRPEASLRSAPCPILRRWSIPRSGCSGCENRSAAAVVNVFPIAAATLGSKGRTLTDFSALQRAGAVAVTDDGKPILEDDVMRMALRLGAELNFPVVQHAEDTRLTENCSMHAGPTSFRLGLRGMPASAPRQALWSATSHLAQQVRESRLHVAHLSTSDALKAVRRGKRAKARVTCEVTPHHFTLIDENVGEYGTNFKMNPPLRTAADLEAIVVALADGTVDAIATDHAPHAVHEKQVEFENASFGITGLETALALAITKLHREHKISSYSHRRTLYCRPGRVFDLRDAGRWRKADHADVTIFDPKKRWTFESAKSRSLSHNTPFDGWQFTGRWWLRSWAAKSFTARTKIHKREGASCDSQNAIGSSVSSLAQLDDLARIDTGGGTSTSRDHFDARYQYAPRGTIVRRQRCGRSLSRQDASRAQRPAPMPISKAATGCCVWDFLSTCFVMWLLLRFRWSARHAQPGRAHHPLPAFADRALLGAVHCCESRRSPSHSRYTKGISASTNMDC